MKLTADQRSTHMVLDYLTKKLEGSISNYCLVGDENLWEGESEPTIYRKMTWSRGMNDYDMVVTEDGFITYTDDNTPGDLVVQVSNSMNQFIHKVYQRMD